MVASVARVRLLVVVMRSVKQTYGADREPFVHMVDRRGHFAGEPGLRGPIPA